MPTAPDELPGRIAALLGEVLNTAPDTISPDQDLVADLGVDSLAMIEVVLGMEQELGVVVPDHQVAAFTKVGDLTAYVEEALAQTT
jgi:acyl carrier protein